MAGARLIQTWRDRTRDHQLSSSSRAGSWAREEARRNQLGYLRRNWRPFALFLAVTYTVATVAAVLIPSELARGVILGAAAFGTPGLLWGLLLQLSGTAPTLMGVTAEQWTAEELKRLRPSGWLIVHHFSLGHEDVDHLLVGPGGIFCVETKWTASPWHSGWGCQKQQSAADQVSANSRRVSNWHPVRRLGLRAQPLLVLWGGGLTSTDGTPARWSIGQVPVVAGHSLRDWLAEVPQEGMSDHQVIDVWAAVREQAAKRDLHDATSNPAPPSAYAVLMTAIATVTSALLPPIVISWVAQLSRSSILLLAVMLALPFVAIPLLRRPLTRWAARGWVLGSVFSLLWAVGVVVTSWIRTGHW